MPSTPLSPRPPDDVVRDLAEFAQHLRRERQNLNRYERKLTSQNGEDGILAELFKRIGVTNKYFVEFGVQNGMECNTAQLSVYGHWTGLLIEGHPEMYAALTTNYSIIDPPINLVHEFLTVENVLSVFDKSNVPTEPDLLSIDVDGNDYWLWQRIATRYRPRVVVIEYNASFAPPIRWVMKYNPQHVWNETFYFGASLTSLTSLAKQLGYALIGTESRGINAFFVREDCLEASEFPELSPEEGYHPPRYGVYFGGHLPHLGPAVEI
jgi:hypothetical protein